MPTFYHSIQVLLSSDTTPEQAIEAAHTVSVSFINHFRQIISNPKSHHHTLSNPTTAIQSLFLLLTQLYSHPKLHPPQPAQVADIILDLVTNTLSLLNELCSLAVKSAIYNESPLPRDYREVLCRGILALMGSCPVESSLRQGVLLVLVLEFRAVRGSSREGRVACLARDDVLWYLCAMIEECVGGTVEGVGEVCGRQVQELVWESLRSDGEGEMSKGDWLAWKVCGLLCGIGGVELEV